MGIIALIFKEFMSNNHNTIRQCQNCGYYFVPTNLKEIIVLKKFTSFKKLLILLYVVLKLGIYDKKSHVSMKKRP